MSGDAGRLVEALHEMATLDADWLQHVPRGTRPTASAASGVPHTTVAPSSGRSPAVFEDPGLAGLAGPVIGLRTDLPSDLAALSAMAATCQRCPLAEGRTHPVFGEGDPHARLMLIGEGPGAAEDASGRPFVGPAGQLLDKILSAMGLRREETYIGNVVKCRPPNNATPTPEQMQACYPYLQQQIALIRPEFIIALGMTAARALLGGADSVARMRGRFHKLGDIPVLVTYHPAALLRDPSRKRLVWEDVQRVMVRMKPPG